VYNNRGSRQIENSNNPFDMCTTTAVLDKLKTQITPFISSGSFVKTAGDRTGASFVDSFSSKNQNQRFSDFEKVLYKKNRNWRLLTKSNTHPAHN
jgi:hypothetical protein